MTHFITHSFCWLGQSGTTSANADVLVTEGLQASGSLSWSFSIALTVVLIVLTIGWLLRQRELLGTPLTALLSVLRIIVIVIAVWMVTQPSWTRTETISQRAEVIVLADDSGSMETIDPPSTPLNEAWQLAITRPTDPLAIVQRVQLDLQMAARSEQMSRGLIDRATEQLKSIRDSDPGLVDDSLSSLEAAANASKQWQQTDDQVERIAFMASRADFLESALIEVETMRTALQSQEQTDPTSARQSRKQYVASLLDRFEDRLNDVSDAKVSLRRAVFSDRVTTMESDSWSDVLVENVDESSESVPSGAAVPAASGQTDVSGALTFVRSLAPSSNLAAVLILSEGQHNARSGQTPVEVAAGLAGTPIFTVPIGNRSRRRDIAIHRVDAPAMVYQEDRPVIEALISAYGCDGDEVQVTLSEGDRTLGRKTIQFPSKLSDVAVRFELPPTSVGRRQYQLDVEALEGESSLQNNHSVVSVQTIKNKLYLLIADRQPRWEYRYLEQLFRRDNRVELDKLLLMPTLKSTLTNLDGGSESPLPETSDGWAKFDVVILGDLPPEVMTEKVCRAMASWVKAGGDLIVVAGKHYMPMGYRGRAWFDLLPITSQPLAISNLQRPTPAPEGLIHPAIRLHEDATENAVLWQRWMSGPMPGYVSPFHAAKPTASVLASLSSEDQRSENQSSANADGLVNRSSRPAWLSVHRVGSGQVAYLSSPVSYRLRIRAGDHYHHRFWGQLVRWMTTSSLSSGDGMVDIQSDRSNYDEGQRPGIRVRLADASGRPVRNGDVQIELTSQAGDNDDGMLEKTIQLIENQQTAGVYQTTLERLPAGAYTVRAIGPTIATLRQTQSKNDGSEDSPQPNVESGNVDSIASFNVEAAGDLESLMTEADPVLLRQIAEASGGLSIPPAALEEVLHVVSLDPQVTKTQTVIPLWNRWINLWLILGCLTTDWWLRRRKGLV